MCCSSLLGVYAQNGTSEYSDTIKVDEGDNEVRIIDKSAHVVPTARQLRAMQNEFIAFVHFGPNTFTSREWGTGKEDPKVFALKTLDTDQWCRAMVSAHIRMVILTAKHHDGFVLWQSRYTNHGIMSSDFENGHGDIMRSLAASCRKYGLKLGVYLSPADLYQMESTDGLYGNMSAYTMRTIPRDVPGRPFANKTKFRFLVDDYNEYFLNQLFELLTEYGPVSEVWFDGAHPKHKGNQKYNYSAWRKLIRTLAPEATIFGREDIRWCGNEGGFTRNSEWNVITYKENPDTSQTFTDMYGDLGTCEVYFSKEKPFYLHYQPAETNTSIREGWFYRDDTYQKVRNADNVFDIYERSVGGNSIFLLNIPPNRDGRFSQRDVTVLEETGRRIDETYNNNLLRNAKGPKEVLDGNPDTYLPLDALQGEFVISTPKKVTFNRLVISEAVATTGERIEKHAVDAYIGNRWMEIAQSTNVGYRRILRFAPVTTDRVRIRIIASRLNPCVASVSAHYYRPRPEALDAKRNANGEITIAPMRDNFVWRGQKSLTDTLRFTGKMTIYYTTDGTIPGCHSSIYRHPFIMGRGTVKAVAVVNHERGAVMEKRFGLVKRGWKVMTSTGDDKDHPAQKSFDEDSYSYWKSPFGDSMCGISIDLGKNESISGFAYTPQRDSAEGMIEEGLLQYSDDGINWKDASHFTFGNLINDPTQRFAHFEHPIKTRYVRMVAKRIAADGKIAAMAELDLY